MARLRIPLTLGEACDLIGIDISPDDFVATALVAIGRDLDVLSDLTSTGKHSSYDAWAVVQNLAERVKFAARVARVLEAPASAAGAS